MINASHSHRSEGKWQLSWRIMYKEKKIIERKAKCIKKIVFLLGIWCEPYQSFNERFHNPNFEPKFQRFFKTIQKMHKIPK